jgi:hypothetical protein
LASARNSWAARYIEVRPGFRAGNDDAVMADRYLGDLGDAVLRAGLGLALLDLARGADQVGRRFADAFAEQLDSAAGAGRFHHRGLEHALLGERFGHRGGKG